MASDLQLALDFVVRDLGSDKFVEIAERAKKAGLDIQKTFDEATKAGEKHEKALGKSASAVEHLGSTFAEQLGPAGGVVEDLVRQVGGLGGSLEDLIAKTGLSSGALLGLAGGAIAVTGLATALEKAAEQAERIEKAVVKAAAGTRDFETSKRLISQQASRDSQTTGIPQEQIAGAAGAALGAFGSQSSALQFLQGPETLAVAQLGKLDDLVQRSIPLFKGYGLAVSDSERIFAELAVTAREVDEPIDALLQTMADGAPIARRLGLSFEDSLSLIGAAGKEGAPADEVRLALQRLLGIISDADNGAHKRLQALGVNFQQDLSGVIESINKTIEANGGGNLFEELFPAGRGQAAISSLLKSSRSDIEGLKLDFVTATKDIRDLALQVGNEPGEQLSRASEQLRNTFASIGKDVQEGKAKLFGAKFELPVEITLPDNLTDLVTKIRNEVAAGNLDGARIDLAALHDLGDNAGKLYGDAYAAAVKERQEQLAREFKKIVPGKRDPSTFQVDSIGGLDEKSFVEQAQRAVTLVDQIVQRASITVPIEIAPAKDLPAQLDLLQTDIQRAIRAIDLTPPGFRPQVLPPDVAQAQKALDELEAKLKQPDGTTKSTEALLDSEKQRARDAVGTILKYYADVVSLQRISLGIDSQTGGALDKQVAAHQAVLQSVRDALTELKLQPDQVDKVRAKLPALAQDFARIEQLSTTGAGLDFQARALAAREKSLTTARDLARVQGDIAAADEFDRQILETKAREQRTAILQQQSSELVQAGNDDDHVRRINERTAAQLAEVNAAEKLAGINLDRGFSVRDLQNSSALAALQKELLFGLDAELSGIEATVDARKRAVIQANLGADAEANQLDVLDHILARNEDLARSNALLGQADAISNLLGGITESYSAQVAAINNSRSAERVRFEENLRNLGTELNLRDQLLDAFDRETQARKRDAAIGFAGRSASDLAREKLQRNAFDGAADASAFLGEGVDAALQRQIDAVTRATDSAEAWSAGWHSGIDDALRQMDKFNTALQFGGEIATGFRDSLVAAFDGVGQKGHNFLKDFAQSELKGLQHSLATVAANGITSALGSALGFNLPNKVDPLSGSSAVLASAGTQLIVAATELQAAAFTLGASGIGSGIGKGVSSFLTPETLAAIDPLGGSTGGVVYGFANGGIGRNGRKRTDPRDTIPAFLRKDEFVLTPEAVQAAGGVGYLDNLNRNPSSSRARQRVVDSTPARVVNIGGNTVNLGDIVVHVSGEAGNDPQAIARAVREQVVPAVAAALESGSSRRLVEAVRGAAR